MGNSAEGSRGSLIKRKVGHGSEPTGQAAGWTDRPVTRRSVLELFLLSGLAACGGPQSEMSPKSPVTSQPGRPEGDPRVDTSLISPEMQRRAGDAFTEAYNSGKVSYLIDEGNGTQRTLFDTETRDTALEVQSWWELFALASGDTDTLQGLVAYDANYKKPNGLVSWRMNQDGTVQDPSAVADVMEDLALVRLLSSDPRHQEEGRQFVTAMGDVLIDPQTKLLLPGDYMSRLGFTNPSYIDPLTMELAAKVDPRWNDAAQASRTLMGKIGKKIAGGEYVYYPKWVDSEGKPVTGPQGEPAILDYDTLTRVPIRQMRALLYSSDTEVKTDAEKHLATANTFFEKIITNPDGIFNAENLMDKYNLDRTVYTDDNEQRYSGTAVTAGAAVAAMVSPNQAYKAYMFKELINMKPDYSFNAYIRNLALLTLSDKMPQAA